MNSPFFIILCILFFILGLLITFIINKYSITLFLIKREKNKILKVEEKVVEGLSKTIQNNFKNLHKELNKKIESLCTVEQIKKNGILNTYTEALDFMSKKNNHTLLFINMVNLITDSIKRLKNHRYPVSNNILVNFLSTSINVIKDTKQDDQEKIRRILELITNHELMMFYMMYAYGNFDEYNLEIININKLTQNELLTFNTVKSIYYDDYIKINKKLDAYETIALKNGLNKFCDV